MRSHALPRAPFVYHHHSTNSRHRGFGMTLGALVLLVLAFFVLAAANAPDASRRAAGTAPAAVPPPAWIDIVHPIQLFDLTAPELAKARLVYAARRNRRGGGRQDILTFGAPAGPFYLRLNLYRVGAEPAPAMPLYVDPARAAAQAGLSIGRSSTAEAMATRFGGFEAADVALSGASNAAVPCLGFRGAALSGTFRILGLACRGARPMARSALACLLDRLDLDEAGDDQALAAFFAASELRRNPACAGTRLAPMAPPAGWLGRNDAPPPLEVKKPL